MAKIRAEFSRSYPVASSTCWICVFLNDCRDLRPCGFPSFSLRCLLRTPLVFTDSNVSFLCLQSLIIHFTYIYTSIIRANDKKQALNTVISIMYKVTYEILSNNKSGLDGLKEANGSSEIGHGFVSFLEYEI